MVLAACPAFRTRWDKHREFWQGQEAGIYNDLGEFAVFIVDDSYASGDIASVDAAFALIERFFAEGNQEVRDATGIGFLEDVRNLSSWRSFGTDPFAERLAPISRTAWAESEETWRGKNSLADVVRAEQRSQKKK